MPPQTIPGVLHMPGQPNFLNAQLLAPNVFEFDMPADIIDELAPLAVETRAMTEKHARFTLSNGMRLYNERPDHWDSDICWLSQADTGAYFWFEDLYRRTGLAALVAPFVPHDSEIRLYVGSFVTRSRCAALNMHCDWVTPEIHAFTLMAPLTPNAAGMGLTYETMRKDRPTFSYTLGKGLVFGPHFFHSTAVGKLDERAVFLCLNFGTDRMSQWPLIGRTTAQQSDLLRQPDGTFISRADWLAANGQASAY